MIRSNKNACENLEEDLGNAAAVLSAEEDYVSEEERERDREIWHDQAEEPSLKRPGTSRSWRKCYQSRSRSRSPYFHERGAHSSFRRGKGSKLPPELSDRGSGDSSSPLLDPSTVFIDEELSNAEDRFFYRQGARSNNPDHLESVTYYDGDETSGYEHHRRNVRATERNEMERLLDEASTKLRDQVRWRLTEICEVIHVCEVSNLVYLHPKLIQFSIGRSRILLKD